MTAPNLLVATSIVGKTTYLTPANTTSNVLLANAAASSQVYKIDNIVATNVSLTATNVTVTINSSAGGAGTSYPIVSTVFVPPNAALIVTDKTTAVYLEEDKSITVKSQTSSAISYMVSYEVIS